MGPYLEDDEDRWADARSVLDGAPTESAEQRRRRTRLTRVFFVVAAVLLTVVLGVVAVVLTDGATSEPDEVPTWQVVTGFSISGVGLVFQCVGLVVAVRATRGLRLRNRALSVLDRAQRKELRARVRELQAVEPSRAPLALALAEQLVASRTALVPNVGLAVNLAGQWIADPEVVRAVLTLAFCLTIAVAWFFLERDARAGRRFLELHPVP